jgi:O-antigen ligase
MSNNPNKFHWVYIAGFFVILALPVLVWPPYFFPVDWGKTIVFRSVLAIMLFLCLWGFLSKKSDFRDNLNTSTAVEVFKKSPVMWALGGLFGAYLLATIFSVDVNFSLWGSPYRGGGFVNLAFCFVFAIMAFMFFKKGNSASGEINWKRALDFSIIIGVVVSLIGIAQYHGWFNKILLAVPSRPPSTMGNPDLLAVYILLLFFITLFFLINRQNKYLKIFYGASSAIFLYTILIAGSRAAYLGLLVGGIYFLLFYPAKSANTSANTGYSQNIRFLKIVAVGLLVLAIGVVFYTNTVDQYPKFLENNKLFRSVESRLLIKDIFSDPRFAVWQIEINAIKAKPILGYGPENFAVGFDKFYDPSLPNLNADIAWYDKAHNVIFQTGVEAGILGIIAYLGLFVVLFWQLGKVKHASEKATVPRVLSADSTRGTVARNALMAHGVQATLIGYLIANFFSFDSFSTYLIFFFLIGCSLHLCCTTPCDKTNVDSRLRGNDKKGDSQVFGFRVPACSSYARSIAGRKPGMTIPILSLSFLVLVIFLWQYNFVPLSINAKINTASNLAEQGQCDQALKIMDGVMLQHSFLDSYARMEYVEFEKTCLNFYPENNLAYVKKSSELIKEAVKIQPAYTRYWLYLGTVTTTMAEQETDAETKTSMLLEADGYLDKALKLAPKHQEIFIAKAKLKIDEADYNSAKDYSEKCVNLNPALSDCYFYLALSQIYLKDSVNADKNLQTASIKGFDINAKVNLDQLANAYGLALNYQSLIPVYEKLITLNSNNAQYHSSLAFFYKQLGRYGDARKEALKTLELSPESKPNVDAFLRTLPQ